MGERKRIRRWLGIRLLPVLGHGLLNWLHRSCRWTYIDREAVDDLLQSGQSFVCPTWHFDHVSVLYHFRFKRGVVMVSRSRDGEIIARLAERWGFASVRGSKHKGGLDAARDMIELVKQGHPAGIVADGSQGPARRAQKGAVFVARAARVPLIPAIVVAKRKITLPTWDRTQIPLPFSPVVMYFGAPITVPPKTDGGDLERFRLDVELALNDLCRRAEEHLW